MATNGTRQQPTAANSRQEALAQQTWTEHDALLIAIHSLEAALAAAVPGREALWARQVAEMLNGVADALAEHVASTEDPDGLFAEIDDTWPTMAYRVERLRRQHSELIEQARALALRVEYSGKRETPDFHAIRRRAGLLLTELRHHQAAETDLIQQSFFVDLGVGD